MQQLSSKYFTSRTPTWVPTPHRTEGMWSKLFQNMVMLHIKLKGMTLQQHGSKCFTPRTPLTWGWGRRSFFRTWSCSVAYQMKQNQKCSNMVADILLADPQKQKVRIQLLQKFRTWPCCKLNGIANAATCKRIFCPYTHA